MEAEQWIHKADTTNHIGRWTITRCWLFTLSVHYKLFIFSINITITGISVPKCIISPFLYRTTNNSLLIHFVC
uniref:Uncharacterized protein n=1 Tax=Anopheles quadriannulatus TaxID=34691 RepID=A0A182XRZ8_ANOQN